MRRRRVHYCVECRKVLHVSEDAARAAIRGMIENGMLNGRKSYSINVYRCEHNDGWHVGHDHRVLNLDFSKGRV